MKIDLKLSEVQKKILLIFIDDFSPRYRSYYEIKRAIEAISLIEENADMKQVINIIAGRYKLSDIQFGNRKIKDPLINDLELLIRLNVIQIHKVSYQHYSSRLLEPDLMECEFVLTEEGEAVVKSIKDNRIINYRPAKSLRTSIFVASAFGHKEIDELYEQCIRPACIKFKLEPIRVDLKEPHRTITEEILEQIPKSELIIADLSYARPSVYFEIGYAQGLGIPIILTCNKNHLKGKRDDRKIHFDLQQYKISFWTIIGDRKFDWDGKPLSTRIKNILSKKELSN